MNLREYLEANGFKIVVSPWVPEGCIYLMNDDVLPPAGPLTAECLLRLKDAIDRRFIAVVKNVATLEGVDAGELLE